MKSDLLEQTSSVQDKEQSGFSSSPSEAEKQEMFKRMEEAATPGPAHKAMDALIGSWDAEVKCWHGPGEANVSHGTATARWILNGHFLEEEFEGEMMGRPFNGRSVMGYDNFKETFNSVWISDMQTSMFTSEGQGSNNYKVITLEGMSSCAASGRKDVPVKSVIRILSPDRHTFEMFDASKGEDVRTMEITYTRK